MANITVGSSSEKPENFEAHGQWWAPGREDASVPGTLRFDQRNGAVLELSGELVSIDRYEPTLYGRCIEHEKITLTEVHQASTNRSMGGPAGHNLAREVWGASMMLIGAHVPGGEQFAWDGIRLQMSHLDAWAPASVDFGRGDEDSDEKVRSLSVTIPERINMELDSGSLELGWFDGSGFGRLDAFISVVTRLTFRARRPMTHEALWNEVAVPLLLFANLVTGETNRFTSMHLFGSHDETHLSCRVYGTVWVGETIDGPPGAGPYRFTFDEIRERLPTMVRNWVACYPTLRAPLLQHFVSDYADNAYLEEQFSRAMRSVELWHRTTVGGLEMDADDYKSMLRKIRAALTTPEWQLAKMRLGNGNELTQANRLFQSIEQAEEPVATLIDRYDGGVIGFVQAVVKARNGETHGAVGSTDKLPETQMVWATDTLRAIFLSLMLNKLGVPSARKAIAIRATTKWRSLDSQYNELLNQGN